MSLIEESFFFPIYRVSERRRLEIFDIIYSRIIIIIIIIIINTNI